jgi:LuxR family quorum sensing-dependent transcriptional regulator
MLDQFAEALLAAADPGEAARLFERQVTACGYGSSAYRVLAPPGSKVESAFVFRNWPSGWAEVSEDRKLTANSFTAAESRRCRSGFSWRDVRERRVFSTGEEEVWNVARDWGWRDGFVVPIHGPFGSLSLVSMATTENDLDMSPAQRLRLQMMALLLDERCKTLTHAGSAEAALASLTKRELECMRWVAAGKTDWEIGAILSISAMTVKSHVDKARDKFGAHTRAQAVARLVLCGLF